MEHAPEDNASYFSQTFYVWVWNAIIVPAYERGGLRARHLPSHSNHDSPADLRDSFDQALRGMGKEQSLFSLLFRLHWWNVTVSGILCFFWLLVSWSVPFLLEILLAAVEGSRELPQGEMWALAVALWLASSIKSLLAHHFWTFGERAGKHMQLQLQHCILSCTLGNAEIRKRLDSRKNEFDGSDGSASPQGSMDCADRPSQAPLLGKQRGENSGAKDGPAGSLPDPVTLLTSDASKVSDNYVLAFVHWGTWCNFLDLCFSLYNCYRLLGWPSLLGIGMVLLVAPVAAWLLRCSVQQVKYLQAERDARSAFTTALLTNWRSFRAAGAVGPLVPREGSTGGQSAAAASPWSWRLEDVLGDQAASMDGRFFSGLLSARAMEEAPLSTWMLLFVASRTLTMFGSVALTSASIASYALLGHQTLRASVVFTAMSWLGRVKQPLNMSPKAIQSILSFKVSVDRIEAYLRAHWQGEGGFKAPQNLSEGVEGLSMAAGASPGEAVGAPADGVVLRFRNASFSAVREGSGGGQKGAVSSDTQRGDSEGAREVLRSVTLELGPGLTVVSGAIGTGKSALVAAAMGGLPCSGGDATISARCRAVMQQSPWIMRRSILRNVRFTTEAGRLSRAQVWEALDRCCLAEDVRALPRGLDSAIGDRGSNLSGGQRSRLALARTLCHCWARADLRQPRHRQLRGCLVLLDDPLTACDAHTRQALLRQAVVDLAARGAAVLLTTGDPQTVLQSSEVGPVLVKHCVVGPGGVITGEDQRQKRRGRRGNRQGTTNVVRDQAAENGKVEGREGRKGGPPEGGIGTARVMAEAGATSLATVAPPAVAVALLVDPPPGRGNSGEDEDEIALQIRDLMEQADADAGGDEAVTAGTVIEYVGSCGPAPVVLLICLLSVVNPFLQGVGSSYWLSRWVAYSEEHAEDPDKERLDFFAWVFIALGVLDTLLLCSRLFATLMGGLAASSSIHDRAVGALVGAPAVILDALPLGQVASRLIKDQQGLDVKLRPAVSNLVSSATSLLSIGAAICTTSPWILLAFVVLAYPYWFAGDRLRVAARALQRLKSGTRAPLTSHLTESCAGAALIRAHGPGASAFVVKEHGRMSQLYLSADLTRMWVNQWAAVWLEQFGCTLILAAALLAVGVSSRGGSAAGTIGFSLTFALNLPGALMWLTRNFTAVETQMVAAERMLAIAHLPVERAREGTPSIGIEKEELQAGETVVSSSSFLDVAGEGSEQPGQLYLPGRRAILRPEWVRDREVSGALSDGNGARQSGRQASMLAQLVASGRHASPALIADDSSRRALRQTLLYPQHGDGLDVVFDGVSLRYSPFSGDLGVLNRDAAKQRSEGAGDFSKLSPPSPPEQGVLALRGVTLAIPAGMKLAVVGRSGAGKSTLASCLCALYDHEGQVRVGGRDVRVMGRAGIQRVCTAVVQGDAVTAGLTLMENTLGPRLLAEGCARAARLEATRRRELDNRRGPLLRRSPNNGNFMMRRSVQDQLKELRRRRCLGNGAGQSYDEGSRSYNSRASAATVSAPLLQLALAGLEAVGFFASIGMGTASDDAKKRLLQLPLDSKKALTAVFEEKRRGSAKSSGGAGCFSCCCSGGGKVESGVTLRGSGHPQQGLAVPGPRAATGLGRVVQTSQSDGVLGGEVPVQDDPDEHVGANAAASWDTLHLSAGQRELVAVARAIVRRRPVLLLDEAAAAADAMTADRVHEAVMQGGTTVITICHRLQHIGDFDAVVVMEKGRIVEAGPPGELLDRVDGWLAGLVRNWRRDEARRQESEGTGSPVAAIRDTKDAGSDGATPRIGGTAPQVEGLAAAGSGV